MDVLNWATFSQSSFIWNLNYHLLSVLQNNDNDNNGKNICIKTRIGNVQENNKWRKCGEAEDQPCDKLI